MATSDIGDDVELLIFELSASLAPPQRYAFLAAARSRPPPIPGGELGSCPIGVPPASSRIGRR